MKTGIYVLLICCLFKTSGDCQIKKTELSLSNGVFISDPEIKAVVSTWESYINSKPDSVYDNPYWNQKEKEHYPVFDLLKSHFGPQFYSTICGYYKPTVMSVSDEGDYFKIRTLCAHAEDSGYSDPLAILEVYAKRDGGAYKLYNALPIKTHDWQYHTIGNITFICPQYHTFNNSLATKLDRFVDSVARLLEAIPAHVDYYFADTQDEIIKARGFDFMMGEGNQKAASAHAEPENHIVEGGGLNEWWPHEFVHIYATPTFKNQDGYFQEGIATLIGGSRGHSIEWLLRRADSLLSTHPEIILDSVIANPWYHPNFDFITGDEYVIGGLICKMLIEKGGWKLVRQYGVYDGGIESRFKILKDVFGIERKATGTFIRRKITEYAAKIPNTVQ